MSVSVQAARVSQCQSVLLCATPISRGVIDLTEPISSAVEEKIITAFVAMSTTRDPPGQVTALGSSFRGGHMRLRPDVQIIESGQDIQLISVPNHRTPIPSRVIGHINPLGGRLDIIELARRFLLVSIVAAVQAWVLHIPGVDNIIHCLLAIALAVLPYAATGKGWALIYVNLPVIFDFSIFLA